LQALLVCLLVGDGGVHVEGDFGHCWRVSGSSGGLVVWSLVWARPWAEEDEEVGVGLCERSNNSSTAATALLSTRNKSWSAGTQDLGVGSSCLHQD
jgi:hypothetical protein